MTTMMFMKKSKRYQVLTQECVKEKVNIAQAIAFAHKTASAKFDESIEVHVRLNIDPRKGEQAVRGSVTLPHGTGKQVRVAVITDNQGDEAKKAHADIIGGQELIDKIKAGSIPDVDIIVATPDMMPKLAPAARVLGPRGLMPSPKTDTVTVNVADAVESLKKGKANFKNDNTGNIHQVIGKASFDAQKIEENYNALIESINGCKNEAHKGQLISSVSLCTTMGPSISVK